MEIDLHPGGGRVSYLDGDGNPIMSVPYDALEEYDGEVQQSKETEEVDNEEGNEEKAEEVVVTNTDDSDVDLDELVEDSLPHWMSGDQDGDSSEESEGGVSGADSVEAEVDVVDDVREVD